MVIKRIKSMKKFTAFKKSSCALLDAVWFPYLHSQEWCSKNESSTYCLVHATGHIFTSWKEMRMLYWMQLLIAWNLSSEKKRKNIFCSFMVNLYSPISWWSTISSTVLYTISIMRLYITVWWFYVTLILANHYIYE